MPFIQKFLAEGQLANVETVIYTVPALTKTLIKTIILVNTTAGILTINLYVKKGAGASRRIHAKDYSLDITLPELIQANIILEAGDTLRGSASSATSVDYTVFGIEET